MARSDGPFVIIEKVGSNAYKLQLPGDMAVSATFNIGDLSPYVEDAIENPFRYYSQQKLSNLRSNPSEEGEDDEGALAQKPKGSTSQGGPRPRGHSGPILIHKLPGLCSFGDPFLVDQTMA